MKKAPLLWLVVLLGLCVLALVPAMPSVSLPKEDSGIFLYFGQQINAGKLPYVDLFDHKPPMVFYLDALGLALGGRWGVWALELTSLFAAGLAGFIFLRRFYNQWVAGYAILALLLNLGLVLERGNLTEEYALPFQFIALALFAGLDEQRGFRWRSYLIGVCAGFAFMLRQNLIGIWLVLALIVILRAANRREARTLLELLRWAGGAAVVIGGWVVYFAVKGMLPAFWDVAFVYNFVYSDVTNPQRLAALTGALGFITQTSGFFAIASIAWLAGIAAILITHAPTRQTLTHRWAGVPLSLAGLYLAGRALIVAEAGISAWRAGQIALGLALIGLGVVFWLGIPAKRLAPWLAGLQRGEMAANLPLFIAVLDVPVELGLITLSATNFAHYFMALLPALTLLIGFFAASIISWAGMPRKVMPAVWLALFLIPIGQTGATLWAEQSQVHFDEQLSETVAYIKSNTQPSEKILVWGFNTGLYYLSERQAASRFMMQGPLYQKGYTSPTKVQAFLDELKANPPALIIDTRMYPFTAIEELKGAVPKSVSCLIPGTPVPDGMLDVFSWMCGKYAPAASFGRDNWLIYRLRK